VARAKIFADETKIIDAAFEQIKKDGYEKFSLRGLAREFDVNPMTLYHYVSNKTEIVKLVIIKGLGILQEMLVDAVSQGDQKMETPGEIYRSLSRIIIEFAVNHQKIYILMFNTDLNELRGDEELKVAYRGATALYWDRLPVESRDVVAKEVLVFEILLNGLIIKHLRSPELFTMKEYFDLIDVALGRLFTIELT